MMHDDQLPVDEHLVRRLLAEQFPAWRDLPIVAVASGATVNAVFRIGEGLAARLPLRAAEPEAVRLELDREAASLTELAGIIPFPVPRPIAVGQPGIGYPLPWAIHSWLPGSTTTPTALAGSLVFADDLAAMLRALRAAPTRGRTFSGRGRGGSLRDHDAWMTRCFRESEALLDVPALRRRWHALRDLPAVGPDVMCHGDLHPGNLLVAGERLAGVLDAGGFGAADPALDLVVAWHLLDQPARSRMRAELGSSDLEWARGAAWALQQSMGLVWYYRRSNPPMADLGRTTLGRVLADPGIAAL